MTQAKTALAWITLIGVVALIVGGGIYMSGINNRIDEVIDSVPEIPTAAEIAAAINIPDTSSRQQQEIWDRIYGDEVEELEEDALSACADEFNFDDVEDLLEDTFGDITGIGFEDFDDDNQDIVIRDLGLDDEDDREVEVDGYFTVSYMPEEGPQIRINDKVYGSCVVTSDDGILEADLTLSL